VALAALPSAARAQADHERWLTVADVEKVTGLHGLKTVPRLSQPGAGGELNFAGPDGKLVLMVNFGNAQLYRKAREQKEMMIAGKPVPMVLFAHAVPGVGDEAFAAPPGPVQYVIYIRQGDRAASISTYLSGGRAALSEAQLTAVGRVILSRW